MEAEIDLDELLLDEDDQGDNEVARPAPRGKILLGVGSAVAACAVAGSILSDPDGQWYRKLRKPAWQPPNIAFPIVWTTLYGVIAASSTATIADLIDEGYDEEAATFAKALGVNLVLNAGWSGLFFRAKNLPLATAGAAALAASSVDLARRAANEGKGKAVALGAYAAWTVFATVLSGTVARLNPKA